MNNIRILLAEDDENLGILLRNYLTAKNYETMLFTDGKLALEAFPSGSFGLCLLDIMMPEMDGLTLAREIRATKPRYSDHLSHCQESERRCDRRISNRELMTI